MLSFLAFLTSFPPSAIVIFMTITQCRLHEGLLEYHNENVFIFIVKLYIISYKCTVGIVRVINSRLKLIMI